MDEFYEEGWTVIDPFADLIGVVGIIQHENITRYHLGARIGYGETRKRRLDKLVQEATRRNFFAKFEKALAKSPSIPYAGDTAIVVCVLTFRDRVLFSVDCPD